MTHRSVPAEFEDLLNRQGRKVLAGTHEMCGALADPRRRFLMRDDLLDRAKAARLRKAYRQEGAWPHARAAFDRPILPESIWDMRRDYGELLPKTSRASTIFFDSRREAGAKAAEKIGLTRLMRSESSAPSPPPSPAAGWPQAGACRCCAMARATMPARTTITIPRTSGRRRATSTCISACARPPSNISGWSTAGPDISVKLPLLPVHAR